MLLNIILENFIQKNFFTDFSISKTFLLNMSYSEEVVYLRTVYSVLNRSPEELIEEIILVDDGSTLEHLGERLQKVGYIYFTW